jgi:hypothetical protein
MNYVFSTGGIIPKGAFLEISLDLVRETSRMDG